MKKMLWPEVAGSEWIAYGHRVTVDDDGVVRSHPDVLGLYAKNLSHFVQVVEVDEAGEELPEDEPEDAVATTEPETEPEAVSDDSGGVSDDAGEELPEDTPEPLDDAGLRALAEEYGVKLGRTKNRDKIVARLMSAGVDVPGE